MTILSNAPEIDTKAIHGAAIINMLRQLMVEHLVTMASTH